MASIDDRIMLTTNQDLDEFRISSPPDIAREVQLTADELDSLITTLIQIRAVMAPPRMSEKEELGNVGPGDRPHQAPGMRWFVEPVPGHPILRLSLHHPGLGWISILLDALGVQAIQQQIDTASQVAGLRPSQP